MTGDRSETVYLDSRLIASVSWEAERKRMRISFLDGHERILNVPRSIFEELISAPSPGTYYTSKIKPTLR